MNSIQKIICFNGVKDFNKVFLRGISGSRSTMTDSSCTTVDLNNAPIETSIRKKLTDSLAPSHLEIVNESYMHNTPDSETHFKVLIVSVAFLNKSLIERHRIIHELLDHELKNGVHALSIVAKTPEQWFGSKRSLSPSPKCRGGFQL